MEDSKQSRKPSQGDPAPSGARGARRKPYRSPELTEYGSVAKLTQGTLTMNADSKGGGFSMKAPCL